LGITVGNEESEMNMRMIFALAIAGRLSDKINKIDRIKNGAVK
jgi:hypothetical protein